MTKVQVTKTKTSSGVRYTIDIVGHAGYAEAGKDIVCAGISTLAFTLLESVHANCDVATTTLRVDTTGEVHLAYDADKKMQDITEAMLIGFQLLETDYIDYINVKIFVQNS